MTKIISESASGTRTRMKTGMETRKAARAMPCRRIPMILISKVKVMIKTYYASGLLIRSAKSSTSDENPISSGAVGDIPIST